MSYYKVTCIRGHQGRKQTKSTITFFFEAESALLAMQAGQSMPGVKHGKLPLSVQEIDYFDYCEGRRESAYAAFKKEEV